MMRKLLPSLLAASLLLWPLAAPLAADDAELTLDQILDKYYEAVGGKDAWKALQAMKQTGKMQMMGMEAPFTVYSMRPNKMRIEFEVQGMTGIQAFDGETGWMVMPFMGSDEPQKMPQEQIDQMVAEADFDGVLMDPQEKGYEATLVGKEDVEGTEAYRISIKLPSGSSIDYFLDAEYFVPIQTTAKATFQGTEIEVTSSISDYKEVDGLMIPHSLAVKNPMGEQVMTVDSIELNPEIDPSIFTMPEETPAEQPKGEGR